MAACTAGGGVCESVWTIGDYLQLHLLQGKKEYLKMMRFCRLGKPLTEEKYFLWMMKEKRFQRQKKAVKSVCRVSRSQKNIIIIRRKQEKIPVDGNQTAWCGTIVQEIWDITVAGELYFPGEKISK